MTTRSRGLRHAGRRLIERLLARRGRSPQHGGGDGVLAACLGPLELQVLESLWRRDEATGVRALVAEFPGTAYTTLMTTLDRLYKKDLLDRARDGRAYLYSPRHGRDELEALLAHDAMDDLLREVRRPGAGPVLAGFVEAVGRRDRRMLDELERLIRDYKLEARGRSEGETDGTGGNE